jgi:hypothetical protein
VSASASHQLSLSERIASLRRRTEFRRAETPEDREDVFRLRHDAYAREGAIVRRKSGLFTDPVDEASNTFLFGVYIDEALASSIRISVSSVEGPPLPTAQVFPDELAPPLAAGKVIIDPTRFVASHAASRQHPELPYLTLRLPWMAMEYFEGDLMLAAVRPEHEAFYRRLWGNSLWAAARAYPGLTKPVSLTVLDFRVAWDSVQRRYPFFLSDARERESLFGQFGRMPLPWARSSVAYRSHG